MNIKKILFCFFSFISFFYSAFPYLSMAGWRLQNPGLTEAELFDIWGESEENLFVVGEDGTILHFNGSIWRLMDSKIIQNLHGIWGSSEDDIFAVGDSGTILRYDGVSWRTMNSGTNQSLFDVWGAGRNDVFTVGDGGIILHYNGSDWTAMDGGYWVPSSSELPDNSWAQPVLRGVWGKDGDNVYAVGGWNVFWDDQKSAEPILVGEFGAILYFDGISWSYREFDSSLNGILYDVWRASEDDFFIVGSNRTILRGHTAEWIQMISNDFGICRGIWGSSAVDVFAVCDEIYHFDGSEWTNVQNFTGFHSTWGPSGNSIYFVGDTGSLLHLSPAHVFPPNLTISEPSGSAMFAIQLDDPPTSPIIIDLTTSNPGEFTVSPETVLLNANNYKTGGKVTVTAVPDNIQDGTQTARIFTSRMKTKDPKYSNLDSQDVTVTILDDTPGVAVFSVSPTYNAEGKAAPVTIEGQNFDANTQVHLVTSSGAEIAASSVTVQSPETLTAMLPGLVAGEYSLKVTGPGSSDILPNSIFFTSTGNIEIQARKKAVIIAGGPKLNNLLWKATQKCADRAYSTLITQGYAPDTIQYLAVEPSDVTGDGNNDVDDLPSLSNVRNTLTDWLTDPLNPTEEVIVYVTGHGDTETVRLTQAEYLKATELSEWLKDLQIGENPIPGNVIIIVDACRSGSFIPALQPPDRVPRITITGTDVNERAWFLDDGEVSFSYRLFDVLSYQPDILTAFDIAKAQMGRAQTPLINAALPDPRLRQETPIVKIGIGRSIDVTAPSVGVFFAKPEKLQGGNEAAELQAEDVTFHPENEKGLLLCRIVSPLESLQTLTEELLAVPSLILYDPAKTGIFVNTWEKFDQHGEYTAHAYMLDSEGIPSIMEDTEINQTEGYGVTEPGDFKVDGKVNMADAILVLQCVAGIDEADPERYSDADGDKKAGLGDAVYVLQKVARLRN